MSIEKFIQGKRDGSSHAGRRSNRQRFESAMQQLNDWRRQNTEAHLLGHKQNSFPGGNSLCYKGEQDGHFQAPIDLIPQDEEVILFYPPKPIQE